MNPPIQMKLKSRGIIPWGGGFRVKDPLTGVDIFAVTWDMLVNKVYEERKANGAPIGLDIENEVENWCCLSHPDECVVVDPRMPRVRNLNLDDVVRGTRTLLAFKLEGSPLVPQEEAERRAAVCEKCPLNRGYSMNCSVCDKLGDIAQSFIGQRRTSRDQQLRACSVCGCSIKVMVHLPTELLNRWLTPEMRDQFSWAHAGYHCWHVDSEPQQA